MTTAEHKDRSTSTLTAADARKYRLTELKGQIRDEVNRGTHDSELANYFDGAQLMRVSRLMSALAGTSNGLATDLILNAAKSHDDMRQIRLGITDWIDDRAERLLSREGL